MENLLERDLYENGADNAEVTITHDSHDDFEIFIVSDDKRMSFIVSDDAFKTEDDFYDYAIKQITKHLK